MVYKLKRKEDGLINRYKARLLVRRFSQQYGFDYDETFSLWLKYTCNWKIMEIMAIGCKIAFLHGELDRDRDIYMEQPKGFVGNIQPLCV